MMDSKSVIFSVRIAAPHQHNADIHPIFKGWFSFADFVKNYRAPSPTTTNGAQ
jgi:hypothetical protein